MSAYRQILENERSWIENVYGKLEEKLSRLAVKSRNKIPYTTYDGEHDDRPSKNGDYQWWTNGFWGGLMWLMYAETKGERYKITAEISEKRLDKAFENIELMNHDTGFLWHILSGASYRLTGNADSKNRNILAAMVLASRYNPDGEYFRCWNGAERGGWTIIDSMMNLSQLYWTSEELGDSRFKKIAMRQADMTMRDHVRADGSVNHIVVHDTEKSDSVLETLGGQGYGVGSCWSRGAGWALYGFMISYLHTNEKRYLATAKKVADYVLENLPKSGWLPLLDFCQPTKPVYYDSTAGALIACGLIELAKVSAESEQETYLTAAIKLLKTMEENWCDWTETQDGILLMGSEKYTHGIHMNIIYGDYFFTEAVLKLKGNSFMPW